MAREKNKKTKQASETSYRLNTMDLDLLKEEFCSEAKTQILTIYYI